MQAFCQQEKRKLKSEVRLGEFFKFFKKFLKDIKYNQLTQIYHTYVFLSVRPYNAAVTFITLFSGQVIVFFLFSHNNTLQM